MFKKFTNGCVRVVNRWLPDAFLFAIILSIIVFIGSMCATKMGPLQVLNAWGDSKGFWGLLSFSMQMALVLVFGSAMAAAKPCKKALRAAAGLCHNNMQAIVVTTFISTICCWLNWGFGLIAGTLLAKEVVRRVPTVDYPLLIASAYSGFVIWHAGLSGSIPLDLVAGKDFGGVLYQAPITDTVFHPMNLIMVGVILFVMPLVNYAMHNVLCQIQIYFLVENSRTCHNRNNDTFQIAYALIHIFSNIINHFRWELQSVAVYLITQDVFAKFYGRLFEFGYHTPFETGQQTFFDTLQQHWSAVGSQNELLAVLMQMIEDMEEVVLSFGNSGKLLNIINDKYINSLVEVDKVVGRVVTY